MAHKMTDPMKAKGNEVARPFEHDCAQCYPVGWFHPEAQAYNVYFCPNSEGGGSIILRFGEAPEDYASFPVFPRTGGLGDCGYGPGVELPSNAQFREVEK